MSIEEPKKPNPDKFDLTNERYLEIKRKSEQIFNKTNIITYLPFAAAIISVIPIFQEVDEIAVGIFLVLIIFTITNGIIEYIDKKYTDFRLNRIKGYKNYSAYENALLSYKVEKHEYNKEQKILFEECERERLRKERNLKRKQHQYWMSIDPYEFEKEIALLFEKQGYKAYVTKGSGDGGIDIKLDKSGERGIVQCKRFKNKVGPGPIRDLYGTMKAGKYKYGFIVCPSGFSDKAYEFSKGKSIKLIGLKRIMEIVNA